MSPHTFDDDDVGKAVLTDDGRRVGTLTAVRRGTAYVDPKSGKTTITSVLGWQDIDDEYGYPLQESAVAKITDETVRVESRGDLAGER